MRLIKLLAYLTLGYMIYEFYLGMQDQAGGSRGRSGQGRRLERALDENAGRTQNVTGTGRGESVSIESPGGATRRGTVGRGVVTP